MCVCARVCVYSRDNNYELYDLQLNAYIFSEKRDSFYSSRIMCKEISN